MAQSISLLGVIFRLALGRVVLALLFGFDAVEHGVDKVAGLLDRLRDRSPSLGRPNDRHLFGAELAAEA